ncbi:MYG1 family protein [bacterium]|nr:MYG1 family protein [bacterium]
MALRNIRNVVMPKGVINPGQVLCFTLLKMINPYINLYWVASDHTDELRKYDRDNTLFLYFPGWGDKFDPLNMPTRNSGCKYSEPGLLWQIYGKEIVEDYEIRKKIDSFLFVPIDNYDNNGSMCQIALIIKTFNIPNVTANYSRSTGFMYAVEYMTTILSRIIEYEDYLDREKREVEKAYLNAENDIVVLPYYVRWQTVLIPKEHALFVMYPSKKSGYSARCIPKEFGSEEVKKEFPNDWYDNPESYGFSMVNKDKKLVMSGSKDVLLANLLSLLEENDNNDILCNDSGEILED